MSFETFQELAQEYKKKVEAEEYRMSHASDIVKSVFQKILSSLLSLKYGGIVYNGTRFETMGNNIYRVHRESAVPTQEIESFTLKYDQNSGMRIESFRRLGKDITLGNLHAERNVKEIEKAYQELHKLVKQFEK